MCCSLITSNKGPPAKVPICGMDCSGMSSKMRKDRRKESKTRLGHDFVLEIMWTAEVVPKWTDNGQKAKNG